MEDLFLVAISSLKGLKSPRVDLSEAIRREDKVENKSFESTTTHNLTSVFSSSSMDFTSTFPSSMSSPAAKVSADAMTL